MRLLDCFAPLAMTLQPRCCLSLACPAEVLLTIIERSATPGSLLIVPSSSLRAPSSSSEPLVRVAYDFIWSNSALARLTRDAEKPSVN